MSIIVRHVTNVQVGVKEFLQYKQPLIAYISNLINNLNKYNYEVEYAHLPLLGINCKCQASASACSQALTAK
jgi:hypothetical protein